MSQDPAGRHSLGLTRLIPRPPGTLLALAKTEAGDIDLPQGNGTRRAEI